VDIFHFLELSYVHNVVSPTPFVFREKAMNSTVISEIFMAARMMTFWVLEPRRHVGRFQISGETCCLNLQS
jgi:hypothetical protein